MGLSLSSPSGEERRFNLEFLPEFILEGGREEKESLERLFLGLIMMS